MGCLTPWVRAFPPLWGLRPHAPSRTSLRCARLWPTHPPSDFLHVGAPLPRPRRISARGVAFAGATCFRGRSGPLAPRVRVGVRAFRRLPGEKAPRAHRSSEGERVSPMGGCFDRDARIPRRAPHTPIPDERALRAAPAHPPALGMFYLWGLRPHAPAGSAAPPKPRGRSGPLSPGERVGVRAHRGRRDASDLSLAACLSSFDGVCGSRAGAWGAAPTENTIEGGWASRAAARARPSPSRAPRLRGRASPRLRSVHAGAWGAQPPTEKNNPGRVGGPSGAQRTLLRDPSQQPVARAREPSRSRPPSAARARYRRGSSLRLENCRRPAVRSPGCGSPAARRAATAARPARARRGWRGTGPHPRRTGT